jgi:hypothetical protein
MLSTYTKIPASTNYAREQMRYFGERVFTVVERKNTYFEMQGNNK